MKKRNTDRVKRPVLSAKLQLWENTSKLAGTNTPAVFVVIPEPVMPRCKPATVTPISPLNKYGEVLTPPCLDSQAGSPDSRAALRRTYQHRPPYRNAARLTRPRTPPWPGVCVHVHSEISVSASNTHWRNCKHTEFNSSRSWWHFLFELILLTIFWSCVYIEWTFGLQKHLIVATGLNEQTPSMKIRWCCVYRK